MYDADTPFDLCFRREACAAFAHRFKKGAVRRIRKGSYHTSAGSENRMVRERDTAASVRFAEIIEKRLGA